MRASTDSLRHSTANPTCSSPADRLIKTTSKTTMRTYDSPSHTPLEPESPREDRAFHVDVEAQIAVACLIVKIEAAITQMKVDPAVEGVVDRAYALPIGVRADAEAADI